MVIVKSEESVQKLIDDLNNEQEFITVDTEFIREISQLPLLCLLQLTTQRESYVIDPVGVDIKFLKPFFADSKLKKVFHDARQDMEILKSNGFEINNFYDTQLYEMLLSTRENVSYQQIVLDYTNKKLSKNYGLSDWSKRPLSKKQLLYAVEDVIYLRKVYKQQRQKLVLLHRENWLDGEINHLMEKNSLEDVLDESVYPLLHKLLSWRENRAKKENVSLDQVASNRVIKSICKKGLEYIIHLKHSRNLTCEREFLSYAENVAMEFSPEKVKEEKNPVVDLLKTLLVLKSGQYSIAPIMLASVKDLFKFASEDFSVKFLKGWRREIFGNAALDLLNGKIKLGVKDNKVFLYDE